MLTPIGIAYAAWLTLVSLARLLAPVEDPTAPPAEPPAIERPATEEIIAP